MGGFHNVNLRLDRSNLRSGWSKEERERQGQKGTEEEEPLTIVGIPPALVTLKDQEKLFGRADCRCLLPVKPRRGDVLALGMGRYRIIHREMNGHANQGMSEFFDESRLKVTYIIQRVG